MVTFSVFFGFLFLCLVALPAIDFFIIIENRKQFLLMKKKAWMATNPTRKKRHSRRWGEMANDEGVMTGRRDLP
jgi:hypothetical protein